VFKLEKGLPGVRILPVRGASGQESSTIVFLYGHEAMDLVLLGLNG